MQNTIFAYTFAERDKAYLNICIYEVYGKRIEINSRQEKTQENLYYEMLGQAWFSKTLSHIKNNPNEKKYKIILDMPRGILKTACKKTLIKHPNEKYFSDAYSQELLDMIKK